jgi:hypothetical protein
MKIISILVTVLLSISSAIAAPQIKEVCKPKLNSDGTTIMGKDGKPVTECKKIKVHKKLDGTKVPDKK